MRKRGKNALRYQERCCVCMKIITVYDDKTQEQIDDIKGKIQEKTVQYEKLIADEKLQNIQYKMIQDYKTEIIISDLQKTLCDIIEKAVQKTIVIAESEEEKEMLNTLF